MGEHLFGQNEILRISHFDVGRLAIDHIDRLVGEVAMHDATVVGGDEVGVAEAKAIGFGDGLQSEALRGLHVAEHGAWGDVADVALGIDLYDGVGAGDGYIDGLILLQGCEAVGDDALADEGTDGVVDEEGEGRGWGLGFRFQGFRFQGLIESDGGEGGIVALFASGHDVLDFGVGGSDLTDAVDVVRMGYDDNLVDAIVLMKSSDRVLQNGAACYLYELFGLWSAHAPATAAGKKYGNVHWFHVSGFQVSGVSGFRVSSFRGAGGSGFRVGNLKLET